VDSLQDRQAQILFLLHRQQRVLFRRLDAEEDGDELGRAHQNQQFRYLRDVERRLAVEIDREAVALLPADQVRQQAQGRRLVGDEIVVDEITAAAPPAR